MMHRFQITALTILFTISPVDFVHAQPQPPTNLRVGTGLPAPPGGPGTPSTPSGAAHDYFDALKARPEHFYSRSLRDQAQVNALTSDGNASTSWTYNPANDGYPDAQDALKVSIINPPAGEPMHGKGGVPGHDILWFNSPSWNLGPETESIIIIWDQYWGPEFRMNAGGITHLKTVGVMNSNKSWWTLMQSPGPAENTPEPNDVAVLGDNFVASGAPPGMLKYEPTVPSGPGTPRQQPYTEAVPIFQGKWHRNILEIRPARSHTDFTEWNAEYGVTVPPNEKSGTWHMVSRWVIHEDRDPQRVMYRVPMGYGTNPPLITGLRFTMDSSKVGFIGPWYGYFRNFIVLKNYQLPAANPELDGFIFQRPVR